MYYILCDTKELFTECASGIVDMKKVSPFFRIAY